jgi:ABC-type glycerol-3-phosphate transport system substrate-binding protein
MKEMSKFQLFFIAGLIFTTLLGVALFAMTKANSGQSVSQTVVWGTLPSSIMSQVFNEANEADKGNTNISYVQKDAATFEQTLIENLARGTGPDGILINQGILGTQSDKLVKIPYTSITERVYRDSFIQGSEVFMDSDGVWAMPFSVDPLVMYWNRDLFAATGFPSTPKYWDEFFAYIPKLTIKDEGGNIKQSGVALGEFRNIDSAKEILSTIILQSGNPITAYSNNRLTSVLSQGFNQKMPPAEEALRFYTEFSNPTKDSYSWNRSLPRSRQAFIDGKVALYFGYASEAAGIRNKNPNLNFDVAQMPQIKGTKVPMTYGNFVGLAILKSSPNAAALFHAYSTLMYPQFIASYIEKANLPPIRRDMYTEMPTDAYRSVFYQAALVARSWVDPNPKLSDGVFADMIENVSSGKLRLSEAVVNAERGLNNLIQ